MAGPDIIDLVDPRGRADRKGLVILAAIVCGAQFGIYGTGLYEGYNPQSAGAWVFHFTFFWLGIAAVSKRLHDLGISAWWVLWAMLGTSLWSFIVSFAVVLTLGIEATTPDAPSIILAMILSFAPLLGLTLWLHVAKGDPKENRFGPVTGSSGFSKPYVSAPVHAAVELG